MTEIILQTNGGKFVSKLLNGRYQVLESCSNSFYIVDHTVPDLLHRDHNGVRYFLSKQDAIDAARALDPAPRDVKSERPVPKRVQPPVKVAKRFPWKRG